MRRKNILKLLEKYEEHELFYKDYYLAKQNPDTFQKFLQNLDAKNLYDKRLIVPEIKGSWSPIMMNEKIMNSEEAKKEIAILKHFRYTPSFLHQHTFFELIYCISGSCKEEIDGHVFTLQEGQFCLIPPHTTHSIGVFDDSIIVNIIIWRRTFEDIFFNLLRNSNIISDFFNKSLFLYEQNSYMVIDTLKNNTIKNIVLEMYEQSYYQKPFYNLVNNSQIMYIFALILQNYDKQIYFPNRLFDGNSTIIEMISYIEHHFKEVTLETLASHFNFSSNYCSRYIKQYTQESFTDILLTIKFTKAKNLLESSNYSILQISEQCGFNNIEHFNRLFKKKFKQTPGQYRKEYLSTYY